MIVDEFPVNEFNIVSDVEYYPDDKAVVDIISNYKIDTIDFNEDCICARAKVTLKDDNYLQALKETIEDGFNQFQEIKLYKIRICKALVNSDYLFIIKLYGVFINK
jgi:hypothetical protein